MLINCDRQLMCGSNVFVDLKYHCHRQSCHTSIRLVWQWSLSFYATVMVHIIFCCSFFLSKFIPYKITLMTIDECWMFMGIVLFFNSFSFVAIRSKCNISIANVNNVYLQSDTKSSMNTVDNYVKDDEQMERMKKSKKNC